VQQLSQRRGWRERVRRKGGHQFLRLLLVTVMSSLAACQADGYYHPPSEEGEAKKKKKRKNMAPPTIRFEMPLDGVCLGCSKRVARGTRFNAVKSKVGMYLSTPIFEFSMQHAGVCDQQFRIQTDPKNATYVFADGIRLQVHDYEPDPNEYSLVLPTKNKSADIHDPMAKLEREVVVTEKVAEQRRQIAALIELQERKAKDYDANARLRNLHRAKKQKTRAQFAEGAARNLSIPLLPATAEDIALAKRVFPSSRSLSR